MNLKKQLICLEIGNVEVFKMKEAGYTLKQAIDVFAQMDIQPTITAHPTELDEEIVLTTT